MKLFKDFYIEVSFTDRIDKKLIDGHTYERRVDTYLAEYWRAGAAGQKVRVYDDRSSAHALEKLLREIDFAGAL